MDLLELTETIIKSLVKNTENIEVKEVVEKNDLIEILVKVDEADMSNIIGREGRVINAIRTLIQEASSLRDNKYVKIEIEKF